MTRWTCVAGLIGLTLVVGPGPAAAQAPAPPAPVAAAPAAPQAPQAPYTYNPGGRRDPFVSLLRRGTDVTRPSGKTAEGVAGMGVNDLVLKGIMQSGGRHVALVQAPDNRTYVVRVNDRLADGSVRAITADTLVLMQDVSDPLSATKQREVRKTLRAPVEQK